MKGIIRLMLFEMAVLIPLAVWSVYGVDGARSVALMFAAIISGWRLLLSLSVFILMAVEKPLPPADGVGWRGLTVAAPLATASALAFLGSPVFGLFYAGSALSLVVLVAVAREAEKTRAA